MLTAGMLWFQNDSLLSPTQKIEQAAAYYQKKYGRRPNLVLVHPGMLEKDEQGNFKPVELDGLTVRPYHPVLPGHIWIGIDESADVEKLKAHNEA